MPWQPLPDDAPLDHEQLQPPQQPVDEPQTLTMDAPVGGFAELPPDAALDGEAPPEPPALTAQVRTAHMPEPDAPDVKSQEIDPSYTVRGFSNEVDADPTYHSGLSKADKHEYAAFFADPKHPPSAAQLQHWYHAKTGALLGNAQQIVDVFKKTGKFSTVEQVNLPVKHQSAMAAGINHVANAVGADWGPEIAAPLDALGLGGSDRPNIWTDSDQSFGNLVGVNADLERAQLEQDTADHPYASIGGELAGVALSAPLMGGVGKAAQLGRLGETNRALVQTAGEGFAYGSGAAGPGHRMEGGSIGAALAPVVGVAAKLPVAGYRVGKTVLQGSPGLARRIIAKAIKDDANTPDDVGQAISEAHANGVPMALGDTGENVRGLLAASSRASGMGRTIVRDALETRQAALADRITQHIERDLGPVANPHQVADELMTKARTEAGPLYEQAYAAPGAAEFSQKVAPLLQRPSMKKALSNAYRIAQEEGEDPEALGLSKFKPSDSSILDANGKPMQVDEVQLAKAPTWKTLDYIKRGMDDVVETYRDKTTGKLALDTEGRATNNTLRSYMSAFDDANPSYAAARKAYAGPVKGISAMNLGRKALNMTADDLEARLRDLSPYEKQMFALGTRRAMAELVQSKGDTADIVHALVGTGKKRAMLARSFGDRKQFQRFVDTLSQEREGWRSFRQALLGSPTAANVSDDATLNTATLAADFMTTGLPVATSLRYAMKFGVGKLGEKAKQQIAALLSNTDPAAIRELAAELRAQAEKRGLHVRRVNNVTGRIGTGTVAISAQH